MKQKDVEEGEERRALSNLNGPSKGSCPRETSFMALWLRDARFNLCPLLKESSGWPLACTPGVAKWGAPHLGF